MSLALGGFSIAAALLCLGGASKAWSPQDTTNALRASGVPANDLVVRLGGLAEAALGAVALVRADPTTAALVALSYFAFAAFVVVALVRHTPLASCGCIGKTDSPPSLTHVVVDVIAGVCALAVWADPGPDLPAQISAQPLLGIPYVVLLLTGVVLAFLVLARLPRLMALARVEGPDRHA